MVSLSSFEHVNINDAVIIYLHIMYRLDNG